MIIFRTQIALQSPRKPWKGLPTGMEEMGVIKEFDCPVTMSCTHVNRPNTWLTYSLAIPLELLLGELVNYSFCVPVNLIIYQQNNHSIGIAFLMNRQKRGVNQSINAFQKKCLLWKWTFIGWYYNHALSIFLCILLCLSRPLKVLEMGASYTCKRTPFKHDTFQQSVTVLKMLNDTYTFSGYKYLWYQYRYIFFRDQYFLRDSAFPRSEAE